MKKTRGSWEKLGKLGITKVDENTGQWDLSNIRFYYEPIMKNEDGHAECGVVSVCVIRFNDDLHPLYPVYVRGVAYCTPRDQFNKKLGRTIALGRAVQAIENRSNKDDIMVKAADFIWCKTEFQGWQFYSQYNVTLNYKEKHLFNIE